MIRLFPLAKIVRTGCAHTSKQRWTITTDKETDILNLG